MTRLQSPFISRSVLALLALLLLALPSVASAKERAKLNDPLGTIQWGDSKVKVLEKLKEQRLEQLLKDKALVKDRVRMQRARQEILEWTDDVDKSFVRFSGKTKGYDVSIVANHYAERNGESMLVARDPVALRYYFFANGQLYKLVVAYSAKYVKKIGFESFAAQTARKYGRPISSEYGALEGKEELVKVTWTDGKTEMDVENMKEFYGTYSMVFKDRQKVKEMRAQNAKAGGAGKEEGTEVSSEVALLTEDSGAGKNKDAVDSLIGGVNVDLTVKELQEEQAQEEGKKDVSGKEKADKKPKKAKASKKRIKKDVTARDFKDLEAKGGDDELIIY